MDLAAQTIGLDETPPAVQANTVRPAERRLAVYLTTVQRRWLRGVEADALQAGVRLSTSAIVRLAIDELRIRGVSGQDLAERLASFDQTSQLGSGLPGRTGRGPDDGAARRA